MTQALAAVRLRSLRMPTAGSLAVAALLLVLPLLLFLAVSVAVDRWARPMGLPWDGRPSPTAS